MRGPFINNFDAKNDPSPNFLPLKYRPKKIPGETTNHTSLKLQEAHFKFQNDTELMSEYSDTHSSRMTEVDRDMTSLITSSCKRKEEIDKLLDDWKEDTRKEECLSLQVWDRHENFLRRKKHEDEVNKCYSTSVLTWDDLLSQRYSGNPHSTCSKTDQES